MPQHRPGLRLRLLTFGLRLFIRPRLSRTASPAVARLEFDRAARLLFKAPPFLLRLCEPGGPPLHWVSCGPVARGRVILYFHGGAYVTGSPRTHEGLMGRLSALTGLAVVAPAYRLAPEHPAPAALEDARAAHSALIARGHAPGDILLGGDSAGGGLALALLADLCARDLRPAAAFAFSPWTDLGCTGASIRSNAAVEPLLPVARMAEVVGMIRGALPPDDPRLSPLGAAFAAPPPVFLQVGSTEILRDDTLRMADRLRAAGGQVRVEIWAGAPHVWQIGDGWFPEARAALRQMAGFLRAFQSDLPKASR